MTALRPKTGLKQVKRAGRRLKGFIQPLPRTPRTPHTPRTPFRPFTPLEALTSWQQLATWEELARGTLINSLNERAVSR